MKFGVRECANMVFKAKSKVKIGNTVFQAGQPVLYIDTATTSTLEGAATTVYAQGGRGNTRLIAWEGEKTLTFTVEDALLSPIGFSILSGAGLLKGPTSSDTNKQVHFHTTISAMANGAKIELADALGKDDVICEKAPIFVMKAENDGSITGELLEITGYDKDTQEIALKEEQDANVAVVVDCYLIKNSMMVDELQIDAENFAGYYYVEADTLFRRQNDGVDMPANITLPNVKIQSNFTFAMASTGDPSTFTFTMDAFPGYTYFNRSNKVLCAIQILDDASAIERDRAPLFPHEEGKDDKVFPEDMDEEEFLDSNSEKLWKTKEEEEDRP